ncbi:MAG TPA: ABC transporter permease, partial [Acidimicrobiia bacterium]
MTTASLSIPRSRRVGLRAAARHTLAITVRNAMRFIRLPQLLIFHTVQPVIFLLLFTFAFGGAIELIPGVTAAGGYINYLIPGILVQQSVFGSIGAALGLTEDLRAGVLDRFRSLPIARSAVLAGRTFADLGRNTVVALIMVGLGTAFGWRAAGGLGSAILAVGLALLFGYAFSWVMAAIGLATKTPEAAEAAGFLPLFPLVFASSAFLPTATMPGWLEAFANVQPISIVANAVRALTIDEGARVALGLADPASLVVQALLWIVGIVVVCGP